MRYFLLTIAVVAVVFAIGYRNDANYAESTAFVACTKNYTPDLYVACSNYRQGTVNHDRIVSDWLWVAAGISGFIALVIWGKSATKQVASKDSKG
jgi:uncharacterized protein (UPF0333 family)